VLVVSGAQDAAGARSSVAVGPPWQTLRTATAPALPVCITARGRTCRGLSAQPPVRNEATARPAAVVARAHRLQFLSAEIDGAHPHATWKRAGDKRTRAETAAVRRPSGALPRRLGLIRPEIVARKRCDALADAVEERSAPTRSEWNDDSRLGTIVLRRAGAFR